MDGSVPDASFASQPDSLTVKSEMSQSLAEWCDGDLQVRFC